MKQQYHFIETGKVDITSGTLTVKGLDATVGRMDLTEYGFMQKKGDA